MFAFDFKVSLASYAIVGIAKTFCKFLLSLKNVVIT